MVDRLVSAVIRTAAMIRKKGFWDLALIVVAIICATKNRAMRAFAVVMPIAMAPAVGVTGNHFILDVVAGAAIALFGLWVAAQLDRYGRRIWTLVVPQSLQRARA